MIVTSAFVDGVATDAMRLQPSSRPTRGWQMLGTTMEDCLFHSPGILSSVNDDRSSACGGVNLLSVVSRVHRAASRVHYYAKVNRDLARGVVPRECPACGFAGRFKAFGRPPRYDARCPSCGSLERQRLLILVDQRMDFFTGKRVLHFAPESCVARHIRSRAPGDYRSVDLSPRRDSTRLDIEAIDLEDSSFDVIVAGHVLEHVDDHKALRELRRVLRNGGILVLMIPIVEGWARTFECSNVVDPTTRALLFGQANHKRFYGRDFRSRVTASGFELTEFTAEEPDVSRHSLLRGEKVFVCR